MAYDVDVYINANKYSVTSLLTLVLLHVTMSNSQRLALEYI